MLGGRFRRRPDEVAKSDLVPPELECLVGPCGPYIKSDRAEFHHADKEAQQWILRMEPEDISDHREMLKRFRFWREVRKWINRAFWSGLAAFGLVVTTGEKLAKLPETISDVLAVISPLWTALRGRLGL